MRTLYPYAWGMTFARLVLTWYLGEGTRAMSDQEYRAGYRAQSAGRPLPYGASQSYRAGWVDSQRDHASPDQPAPRMAPHVGYGVRA